MAARMGPRNRHEPLRRKLTFMGWRLNHLMSPPDSGEPGYGSPADLLADIAVLRGALGSTPVERGALARFEHQVRTFGFHLARLDVRQSADRLQAGGGGARAGLRGRGGGGARAAAVGGDRRPGVARAAAARATRPSTACSPSSRRCAPRCASTGTRRSTRSSSRWRWRRATCSPRSSSRGAPGCTSRRPGAAGVLEPAHRAPVRDRPRAPGRRGDARRALRRPRLRRAPRRRRAPPGGHARLLGLGQGLRVPREPVGALRGAGAPHAPGRRRRRGPALLPRPRRLAVPRRRRPRTARSSGSRRGRSAGGCGSPSRAR